MINTLRLKVIESNLCIIDNSTEEILKSYKSASPITKFKLVGSDKVVLRVEVHGTVTQSNIYCLDREFEVIWYAELPMDNDSYPNPICWDMKLNDDATSWDDSMKTNINSFTTSSQRGITVSISYYDGLIVKSELTK